VIDTRRPDGPFGGPALQAPASRAVMVAGQCGIPAGALSVSANVTVTGASADGFVTVFPNGVAEPLESTINYRAGQTRANNAILNLGPNGDIAVQNGQLAGTVHFIVDVTGYFK
jgi:hypothetical protein